MIRQRRAGASTRATPPTSSPTSASTGCKNRDKSKPFLLMCQHKAPHREWEPALRHLGHDDDRNYPEPRHAVRRLLRPRQGRARSGHDDRQDDDRATTSSSRRPHDLTPEQRKAWDAYYEPRNAAFRKANPQGKDLVRWKYQRYMHDYLGCVKAVDESVGRLLEVPRRRRAGRQHDRRLLVRPGLLPRRARLVRQALDLRGIAAHAAAGPLAGRRPSRAASTREHRLEPRLRRDVSRGRRRADPRRHAGPQPGAAAARARRRPTGGRASITSTTSTRRRTTSGRTTASSPTATSSSTSTSPTSTTGSCSTSGKDPQELKSVYGTVGIRRGATGAGTGARPPAQGTQGAGPRPERNDDSAEEIDVVLVNQASRGALVATEHARVTGSSRSPLTRIVSVAASASPVAVWRV